jgi:hypothetical protein
MVCFFLLTIGGNGGGIKSCRLRATFLSSYTKVGACYNP